MNLFESLQQLNESENKLISEFKEFLASKNAQYIANEIGETQDGMQIVIYDGDWKHEHLYMKHLLDEFFTEKGIDIFINSEQIGESDSDTFSAKYNIEFNVEPKTYNANLIPITLVNEDVVDEVIEPSNFSPDGGSYHDNTSNWKPKINNVDNYFVSDKYPTYQINKSYNGFGQEIWAVIKCSWNGSEEKRIFIGSSFEEATDFVEKKSNLKESTESNSFQIGEEYEWSGLYGGSYTGIVKEIDEENITLDVSWTAEDTGKLVQKEMTYDLETDSEGNVAFIVWRYSGEKGYVYPKNIAVTESNNLNTSTWKQRYKDVDSYKSDKYPEYIIRKSITSAKQEVWQVLDSKTNRELFCSSTFEGAIEFVENKTKESTINESADINLDDKWEYVEKTTTKDDIFGDIVESDYYIKKYSNDMIGYIYPPSEVEKLYRAKLISKHHVKSLGYNVFIDLEPAKDFLDDAAYKLTPVTLKDIETQLEEIDTHDYLNIYINDSPSGAVTAVIEGTLINEEPITFFDSSYIRTQGYLDFIKEKYAEAIEKIDHMRKRGYLGVKDEAVEEDYDDNASTFLYKLEAEIKEATHKYMLSVGFPEDEADDYLSVSTDINDEYVMVAVGAELGYESISNLCDELNKVIEKYDKDAYFEPECPGRIVAYLFGAKKESLNKIEETNHNIIDDKDYATGEEMYNEFVKYLNSLDQIAMNGNDCNWEPSEFNAKNLNADGEIYLECGAYILIYPYVNEWADEYFKVLVVDAEACDLSIQLKNGIEKIFNKMKTDKWKLVFEG